MRKQRKCTVLVTPTYRCWWGVAAIWAKSREGCGIVARIEGPQKDRRGIGKGS